MKKVCSVKVVDLILIHTMVVMSYCLLLQCTVLNEKLDSLIKTLKEETASISTVDDSQKSGKNGLKVYLVCASCELHVCFLCIIQYACVLDCGI